MPSIDIPDSLYRRLNSLSSKLGTSPDELAIDILRDGLSRLEEDVGDEVVSEEERRRILDRLRSLGYLD